MVKVFFCPFFACTKKEPKKYTPSQVLAGSTALRYAAKLALTKLAFVFVFQTHQTTNVQTVVRSAQFCFALLGLLQGVWVFFVGRFVHGATTLNNRDAILFDCVIIRFNSHSVI